MLKIKKADTFPLEVSFCWPSKKEPQLEGSVTAHVRLYDEKEREAALDAAAKSDDPLASLKAIVPRIDGIALDDGAALEGDTVFEFLKESRYGAAIIGAITAEVVEHQREGKARTSWRSPRR